MVDIHHHRAFLPFYLYFLTDCHYEVFTFDRLQNASCLLSIGIQDLNVPANKINVLLRYLERLSKPCRTYLKLIVLLFSVKTAFNKLTQFHTIFNPHAVSMVDFNNNLIIRTDFHVNKKVFFVFQPLPNNLFYDVLIYHISYN